VKGRDSDTKVKKQRRNRGPRSKSADWVGNYFEEEGRKGAYKRILKNIRKKQGTVGWETYLWGVLLKAEKETRELRRGGKRRKAEPLTGEGKGRIACMFRSRLPGAEKKVPPYTQPIFTASQKREKKNSLDPTEKAKIGLVAEEADEREQR